jgi:hypothetical protein
MRRGRSAERKVTGAVNRFQSKRWVAIKDSGWDAGPTCQRRWFGRVPIQQQSVAAEGSTERPRYQARPCQRRFLAASDHPEPHCLDKRSYGSRQKQRC